MKIITVKVWATAQTLARATLDSGSRLNWVSAEVVRRIHAEMKELGENECFAFQLMGGVALTPLGKVEVGCCLEGIS